MSGQTTPPTQEIAKNGEYISPFFQIDNYNTLDLNMSVLIPALVKGGSNIGLPSVTNVTSTTGTMLTAAILFGRNIIRTGPTANYSDTTDTAANIVAAIPNAQVGSGIEISISNTVAFTDTIVGGTGVTLTGIVNMGPNTSRRYVLSVTSLSPAACTLTGISGGSV